MKNGIYGIELDYGDALFRLLKVNVMWNDSPSMMELPHDHKFYELHLARKGSHVYTVNGKEVTLRQDQLLIIPPGTSHVSVSAERTDYQYECISLHLSHREGTAGFYSYFKKILDAHAGLPIDASPALIEEHVRLYRINVQTNVIRNTCALKVSASSFVFHLFDVLDGYAHAERVVPKANEVDRQVLLAELVCSPTIPLSKIAEQMGYSARHTARIIKETYGCSISELRKKQLQSKKE